MNRYYVRVIRPLSQAAYLVVPESGKAEDTTWTDQQAEATAFPYVTAKMWQFDVGGELVPAKSE